MGIILQKQILQMKFFSLVTLALVANVSAVELHNQAHAKGLKAPHQVRALAQDKENFDWRGAAASAAAAANNALNAQVSSKSEEDFDWRGAASSAAAAANNALNGA